MYSPSARTFYPPIYTLSSILLHVMVYKVMWRNMLPIKPDSPGEPLLFSISPPGSLYVNYTPHTEPTTLLPIRRTKHHKCFAQGHKCQFSRTHTLLIRNARARVWCSVGHGMPGIKLSRIIIQPWYHSSRIYIIIKQTNPTTKYGLDNCWPLNINIAWIVSPFCKGWCQVRKAAARDAVATRYYFSLNVDGFEILVKIPRH